MSIVSSFLRKKLGIPEINLAKQPLIVDLVADVIKKGTEQIFSPLSDFDLVFLRNAIEKELSRRAKQNKPS